MIKIFVTLILSLVLHYVKPYLINRFSKQADLISKMYRLIEIIEILRILDVL